MNHKTAINESISLTKTANSHIQQNINLLTKQMEALTVTEDINNNNINIINESMDIVDKDDFNHRYCIGTHIF